MSLMQQSFEVLIRDAKMLAGLYGQETADEEHLLLSLLENPTAQVTLEACLANIDDLRRDLKSVIKNSPRIFRHISYDGVDKSEILARILERARDLADHARHDLVNGGHVLVAIREAEGLFTAKLLADQQISRNDLLNFVVHGKKKEGSLSSRSTEQTSIGIAIGSLAPHQSPAPVRVEERSGKVARLNDGDSSIDADELDFDRWRVPVAASLRELLAEDLGPGTNHSRLRRRLLDLADALAGTIDDIKENQFRLGYAIEALGLLAGVYRTAADEMPALNAAVFVDVDHLHIQLLLGQSKLVAWRRFQQDADADELQEGGADPAVVGASLDEAARVLEGDAAAPVVDPELPRSFRWIRTAIADPATTTRRMVYGAVKSVENVVSFLGQIVLTTAKRTAEVASTSIRLEVAANLLNRLAHAALQLSAALPTEWAWLKPLLDVVSKLHGM